MILVYAIREVVSGHELIASATKILLHKLLVPVTVEVKARWLSAALHDSPKHNGSENGQRTVTSLDMSKELPPFGLVKIKNEPLLFASYVFNDSESDIIKVRHHYRIEADEISDR